MPEGPSILYLRNELLPFKGKVVKKAGGYGPMPTQWINKKKLLDIRTWGKHLLLLFSNGTVRVHLGLFGEVLVNERKKVNRSFFLEFAKGEINGYVVRAEKLPAAPNEIYDWRTDILNKDFDEQLEPAILLLDALIQKWTLNGAELVLYLLQNKKEEEIAGLLNISQSAVNQRKKNAQWFAIEKLIQYFEKSIQTWQ